MKILIVLGSPRKNGNSETVARIIVESLAEGQELDAYYLRLTEFDIAPCNGCGGCAKTGMCVLKDDMINLYQRADDADIIILTSPIYFYGPSAQIKTYIDRFQARWSRKYLLKERTRLNDRRAGYLISTGATQGKKLFDATILITKSFFDAIDVEYSGAFEIRGVDEKGAVIENHDTLREARYFAQNIGQNIHGD